MELSLGFPSMSIQKTFAFVRMRKNGNKLGILMDLWFINNGNVFHFLPSVEKEKCKQT